MGLPEAKAELRTLVRLTRSARTPADRDATEPGFATAIAHLADEFSWTRIAAFLPTPAEPPIARTLNRLVAEGVSVLVPVATTEGLLDWLALEPGSADSTTTDAMGMPIPTRGEPRPPIDLDAVLVPAAAVDRSGNRLGWGKGYYDRFLETVEGNPLVVALVFAADVVDEVPTEPHDRPVDVIATEDSVTVVQ